MLINGEKFACDACVRGHRVSNCQHSDRPLQHINKKGRPVSQCTHCRSMRKSRSAHTKCDCGEKMFKCAHLKPTVEGHKDSCCCNHGGRCTCCHKKELSSLETVPEQAVHVAPSRSVKGPVRARRRATVQPDGMLNFDEHGNRKMTTKVTKASHGSEPYQLNRVNSMFGLSSTSAVESPDGNSPISSSDSAPERRLSRSEAASPLMTGSSAFSQLGRELPPLDISAADYLSWGKFNNDKFDKFDMFTDQEQPIFSAGLSATSIDWSHYDLDFGARGAAADFAPSNYSQPQSYGGFDMNGSEQPPTMTTNTSTSGEPSELDDLIPGSFDELDVGSTSNGFGIAALPDSFLSTTDFASGFDYELKLAKADSQFLTAPPSLSGEEPSLTSAAFSSMVPDEALWLADYTAQGLPIDHFSLPFTDSPDGTMPTFWES